MNSKKDQLSAILESCSKVGSKYHCIHKSPIIHNTINLGILFIILIFIYGVSVLMSHAQWWITMTIGVCFYGWIYMTLMILVVHEATHKMFVISANRKRQIALNNFFGTTISMMLFQDFKHLWKKGHITHHKDPIVEDDPQNCPTFTLCGRHLMAAILKTWIIPGYAFYKMTSCPQTSTKGRHGLVLFTSLLIWFVIFYFMYIPRHDWVLFLSMIFGFNVTQTLNLLKVSMEHGGEIGREEDVRMRTRSSIFPLRHLLMPLNISLHFEHHLNMGVPWYDLGRYHRDLDNLIPHSLKTYFYNDGDTLKQICGQKKSYSSVCPEIYKILLKK